MRKKIAIKDAALITLLSFLIPYFYSSVLPQLSVPARVFMTSYFPFLIGYILVFTITRDSSPRYMAKVSVYVLGMVATIKMWMHWNLTGPAFSWWGILIATLISQVVALLLSTPVFLILRRIKKVKSSEA